MKTYAGGIIYKKVMIRDKIMQVAKSEVQGLLDDMPEQCELEDLQYRLYVLQKIKHGQASYQEDGGVSQADAENRMDKWIIS